MRNLELRPNLFAPSYLPQNLKATPVAITNRAADNATGVARDSMAQWIIFLAQLPAAPSSARVALWRRLKAVGAAGVHNGAWMLPHSDGHTALVTQLAETVRRQGGTAALFTAAAISQPEHEMVLERFRSDRAREYDEFAERARGFFAEIDKETQLQKFTFAELEEIEDDLEKMSAWLGKIRARDFFPDERMTGAVATLEACGAALRAFADEVYAQEGISPAAGDKPSAERCNGELPCEGHPSGRVTRPKQRPDKGMS